MAKRRRSRRTKKKPEDLVLDIIEPTATPATPTDSKPESVETHTPTIETSLVVDAVEHSILPTDFHSLSQSFRSLTQVVEEVGHTLEAQNQRTHRLMERMDKLATTLEVLPQEAERQLEALDAVQRSVEQSHKPLEAVGEELRNSLPQMLDAVRGSNESTRRLWTQTTRVLAKRFAQAQNAVDDKIDKRTRQNRQTLHKTMEKRIQVSENKNKRWALTAVAGAMLLFFGVGVGAVVGSPGVLDTVLGNTAVSADRTSDNWRVERIQRDPTSEPETTTTE